MSELVDDMDSSSEISRKRRSITDYFLPSKQVSPVGLQSKEALNPNVKIKFVKSSKRASLPNGNKCKADVKEEDAKENEDEKENVNENEQENEKESKNEAEDEEHYEVEEILNYAFCEIEKKGKYLVKWKGWTTKYNTWEPYSNLDCEEKLKKFYFSRLGEREQANPSKKRSLELPPDPRTHFQQRSEFLDSIFSPPCFSELNRYFIQLKQNEKGPPPSPKQWSQSYLEEIIDTLSSVPLSKIKPSKLNALKEQLMLKHIRDTRESQQIRLKEWEEEINKMETVRIVVENDSDLEGPPRHMRYITEYLPSQGIIIPDDPPYGCECSGCSLSNAKQCCPQSNGHLFPYNKYGRLRIDIGNPIYECNKGCKCDSSCYNRVVQKGRTVKLCIFRTENDCGWGVKALSHIKSGSFIVEYAGQVITSDEAEERGKQYDAEGRTYLFDLDFNLGDECPYTVDAANFGNVAHFINHSCNPNLAIFNVWINCLDPNLPLLCLFAQRDIVKGEQLTFDYCQSTTSDSSNVKPPSFVKSNRTECRCGSNNCRKWLFEK